MSEEYDMLGKTLLVNSRNVLSMKKELIFQVVLSFSVCEIVLYCGETRNDEEKGESKTELLRRIFCNHFCKHNCKNETTAEQKKPFLMSKYLALRQCFGASDAILMLPIITWKMFIICLQENPS